MSKRKSILNSHIPIRGSETIQLDIFLSFKNWLIHKIIILFPFFAVITIYFFYKFFYLVYLMANNKDINNINFINYQLYYVLLFGLFLTFTLGIKLGKKWNKKIMEADELITSDEYIRGSKLVCLDEFNNQFKNEDQFLILKVQSDKCEREF